MQIDRPLVGQILKLILRHGKPQRVILFGSRATGTARPSSDIDIAIEASDWSDIDFNVIRSELDEEIKSPLKFDLIDLGRLQKKSLKSAILKEGKVIYEA